MVVVSVLASSLAPGSQLAIGSRAEPGIHPSMLRAEGRLQGLFLVAAGRARPPVHDQAPAEQALLRTFCAEAGQAIARQRRDRLSLDDGSTLQHELRKFLWDVR